VASSPAELGSDGTPTAESRDSRRRRQLIEATITSISENGLSGTTVAKVAEIAGLSAGIVNFYFKTKDALLLSTLQHVDNEFERRREVAERLAGDDPVRLLDAMVDVAFDPDVCNPRWTSVWNAFWGEARARKEYMRVCGQRELAQEHQVVELFRTIAEAGGHHHLHPEALGIAFYQLLASLPENVLEAHEAFDFEEAKQTCRNFLTSIFPNEFNDAAIAARREPVEGAEAGTARSLEFATLPTWVYHDPEFYELEVEHVFRRSWLLVGHVSEAPDPGDYISLDVADDRVFVIRGHDDELRAFDNVCRHRASRVVRGETGKCSNAIVCPYHGWSYGYDGRLRGVPDEQSFSGMDRSQIALPELQLEEWMGFVFVRCKGEGPSVSEQLAAFHDEASSYRFEEMRPWGTRTSIDCDFNWKVFVENDAEGYHSPAERPRAALRESASAGWSERMYQRLLPDVETLPLELRRAWICYAVFPATTLRVSPDLVACRQVIPLGPDKCRIHEFGVAAVDSRREMRAARYLRSRIMRRVVGEDLDFCTWTNAGVRSSRYRGGFLSEHEAGVARFQDRIRALLPVATLAERPAPGRVARRNQDLLTPTSTTRSCR
jgi:phenylpropionate dioxygenase-like ring-hydroxylating dioxygenase large terminal subunit